LAAGLKAEEKTILVCYDLGGGTFDMTVVRYTPTSFRVLATDGDVMLGGLDWSKRLSDHLVEQFDVTSVSTRAKILKRC
jgi:molecular chaperone DnaK